MKPLNISLILLLLSCFVSCKPDPKKESENKHLETKVKTTPTITNQKPLVITTDTIQNETKTEDIFIKTSSDVRPNSNIEKGRVYEDTIQFSSYNDDGDFFVLFGKKNERLITFIYHWDRINNDKYAFTDGDFVLIKWKMDVFNEAGEDNEPHYKEKAIDATKLNPTSKKDYNTSLKDYLIKKWSLEKNTNSEVGEFKFKNNSLSILGTNGYTLSTYNFNDAELSKTDNADQVKITIYNAGGGAGGNIVISETYSLTDIDSTDYKIDFLNQKLLR